MKTMCPPSHHRNGFVASHALGYMLYSYTHLASVRFEHSVLWITYDHLYKFIYFLLALIYRVMWSWFI